MTYRDDHDAALQRAEALAREVEELRRKNEALEEERAAAEPALAARRALEELAARKPAAEPAPTPRRREQRVERTGNDERVDEALSQAWWTWLVCGLVPVGAIVVGGALFPPMGIVIGLVAGMFAAVPVIYVCQRLLAGQQRRWLARLPFALSDYLGYLAREHPAETVMTVTVELDVPDAASRKVVADAVAGAMGRGRASFDGDRLVIRSPSIYARFARKRGGVRTTPHNHMLHAWFRKLLRRALLPIARAYPIRAVDVR